MEIKVNEIMLPDVISFNYDELKAEITEKVSYYSDIAYTEETISEAKKDKAELNKLKKALNDERIRRKKEYMKPFEEFEAMVKELTGIIDEPIGIIDSQVKEYEARIKEEKRESIKAMYDEMIHPEGLHLEQIFNEKWLNVSTSMKSIKDDLTVIIQKYTSDMSILESLPEYSFEAKEVYKETLDIRQAIAYATRLSDMAKAKEQIKADNENTVEIPLDDDGLPDFDKLIVNKWHVSIEVDDKELEELKTFLKAKNISYNLRRV